jgi:hypothetical protein
MGPSPRVTLSDFATGGAPSPGARGTESPKKATLKIVELLNMADFTHQVVIHLERFMCMSSIMLGITLLGITLLGIC